MRVLVTGASGFVGSNLVHVLQVAPKVDAMDVTLLRVGAPPPRSERIPSDTRLDATETARRLDVELPDVGKLLEGLAWAST